MCEGAHCTTGTPPRSGGSMSRSSEPQVRVLFYFTPNKNVYNAHKMLDNAHNARYNYGRTRDNQKKGAELLDEVS